MSTLTQGHELFKATTLNRFRSKATSPVVMIL
jgi:hypothetical protein